MQRLSDTSGDWLARDKAEDYNGLSVAAGLAPASLRTLASESVAGQAGHLACLPESPLPLLPATPALPGDGLVFPPPPQKQRRHFLLWALCTRAPPLHQCKEKVNWKS